jgi:hypothetical protein
MPGQQMVHRVTFGVDIEGYSKRSDPEQVELQARLCWITQQALKAAGVKPGQCERQDQGDGQLVSLPPVIDMPRVLSALPHAMQAAIHRVNSVPHSAGRLRLRMSVAQGPVQPAAAGYVGPGVIAASRMLDSQLLRDTLRDNSGADLVVAVSDDLYRQIFRQGYGGLSANDFSSVFLSDTAGKYAAHVWIYVAARPPDVNLVPAFTGSGGAGPTRLWELAIPAAGLGAALWLKQEHDHPEHGRQPGHETNHDGIHPPHLDAEAHPYDPEDGHGYHDHPVHTAEDHVPLDHDFPYDIHPNDHPTAADFAPYSSTSGDASDYDQAFNDPGVTDYGVTDYGVTDYGITEVALEDPGTDHGGPGGW